MHKVLYHCIPICNCSFKLLKVIVLAIACMLCFITTVNAQGFPDKTRANYLAAVEAFKKQKFKRYQRLKKQLTDYPLYPYLEYNELREELRRYQSKQYASKGRRYKKTLSKIDHFLNEHQDSYLDKRLRTQFLKHLVKTKNWEAYVNYFQDNITNTKLQCYYWRAVGYADENIDYEAIKALWLVDKSQPDECDSLFIKLRNTGHLTEELLWQRHKLVIKKRNYKLAHYLQRRMNRSTRYMARLYEKIHKQPERIKAAKNSPPFKARASKQAQQQITDIVYNGLYRFARKKPQESFRLFLNLSNRYSFPKEEEYKLKQYIAKKLIKKEDISTAEEVIKTLPATERTEQAERLLRHFIALNNWEKIKEWTGLLSIEEAETDRWQYWKARSLQKLGLPGYQEIYNQVAKTRSFYGFMAADAQETPYVLEHKPAPIDFEVIKRLKSMPAIERSYEFYLLNDFYKARLEWKNAIKNLSPKEHISAAHLAHIWGWHRKAIESMAKAKYWDDLTIRFPIVHQGIVHKKANRYNIADALIFSIARQESAWEHDAKSRVGARGLMQLMPATARATAKKAKVRYRRHKLYEPEYNILLGSHYISQLIKQHDNNRALAIAAYNAGPHRVKRWRKKSNNRLGIDAWIEVIPFDETRKYVQNVLSYIVIHNTRLGKDSKLLASHEAAAQL